MIKVDFTPGEEGINLDECRELGVRGKNEEVALPFK